MATYKLVDEEKLDAAMTATADAIRAKTGSTDPIAWDSETGMSEAVEGISADSYYDTFWDAYQEDGTRKNYEFAFARNGWNDITFFPKYDIKTQGAYTVTSMFQSCYVTDIAQRLEKAGVTLDTSGAGYFIQTFQSSRSKRWPTISMENATSAQRSFSTAECETIDLLIANENCVWSNTFNSTNKLKNITFDGAIGNTIDIHWSPLTRQSIESLLSHLSNGSTEKTATISLTAVNNAFETSEGAADGSTSEEWAALIATKPNWTISLA